MRSLVHRPNAVTSAFACPSLPSHSPPLLPSRMFQGVRLLQWSAEKSLCRGLGAMLLRHAESDVVPSFVSTALVLSDNRRETLSARLQQALKAAAAELKAAQALAAAELAAAHDTAADWEDRALDAELELQGCRAQDKAWQEVERLECALERQAAAVTVAEQRAQQAEEALLLEQTAHKHTSQQLNQASCSHSRDGVSGRHAAVKAHCLACHGRAVSLPA